MAMMPPDDAAPAKTSPDQPPKDDQGGLSRERKILIGVGLVVAVLIGLLGWFIWRKQAATEAHPQAALLAAPAAEVTGDTAAPPVIPVVQVLPVRPEPFQKVVVIRGQVGPGPVVEITAPTTGKLTGYQLDAGAAVRPGEVVALMHGSPLPARPPVLDSTRIDAAAYRTQPRQAALVVTTSVPRLAAPAMTIGLASPVTGTLLPQPTLGGNLLSVGQTLAQVRVTAPLTMNGLLDTATARRLRVGQGVSVQLDNGVTVSGTLVQLGPVSSTADDFQALVELQALPESVAGAVAPGMSGRIVVPAEIIRAFKVPSSLLVPAGGAAGVNQGVGLMVVATIPGSGADSGTLITTVAVTPVQPLAVTAPDAAQTPQLTWLTGLPDHGAYVIGAWPSPLTVGQRVSLTTAAPASLPVR